ncbi:hypothetical protein H4R20_003831 [Coemansia guatemalensis]|uniref:Metal homeostatis protein bsd2 n=1 Tax=Coemansia guatemalensis TaxID=2761395 RepID=A0A9W8LSA9_9FUNG|nr:hypothetical protein H4R20_003831 [Coemansia guatemalensis]
MVKERSYKILDQLDEYELQEPGESSIDIYESDSEGQLTREHRANVVPSAVDDDDESDADSFKDVQTEPVHHQQQTASARNADVGASSTSETAQSEQQTAGAASAMPAPTDGVFANMSAKPELYLGYDDKVPNEALPTYQDIYGPESTSAPPYFEAAVISVGDEDELLVEGLPVGSLGVFVVNMIVSAAFQIVGYMLTFLLHSSHAARNGSLAGLGITFMNFGFYIRAHLGQSVFDGAPGVPPGKPNGPHGDDGNYDSDTPLDNAYFSYLLMVIGAGIFIKAIFDYVRVRRLQTIIESSPEQNV